MCGIAGIQSVRKINRSDIHEMTGALLHRGPDANNVFINDSATLALGHTRLSIIDLSVEANQPMQSADENLSIVFNGEIYNFKSLKNELQSLGCRFRTDSDTEVILQGYQQWGSNISIRLDGMFALAIYDKQRDELFVLRDRVGKKPLFYFHDDGVFIFASEIKALRKHSVVENNKTFDYAALTNFLHLGYIPEPATAFDAIKKFPAGHYAVVKKGQSFQVTAYWKPEDDITERRQLNPQQALTSLKDALSAAVEKRLISDVPLGAFLSGGTDSSIITALASRLKNDQLKTYTIAIQENKIDESAYAAQVAKHLKTDHHEYRLKQEDAVAMLTRYLNHFDEPFADTSAIPSMLVSKLARTEVTVALTGDGGDELFLGYGAYDWAKRLESPMISFLGSPISYTLNKWGSNRLKRASYLFRQVNPNQKRSHIFSQEQYYFTQNEIENKLAVNRNHRSSFRYDDPDISFLEPAEKQALFDLQYYLKDDLLVKVDRASMYYGLECRCPMLDRDVIALALNLPPELKINNGERKWILKELLREYLPDELVYRPKWGFGIPLARWLRNELAWLIEKYLSKEMIEEIGMVNYEHVAILKTSFSRGEDFLYNRLWVLIVLHKWIYENS
jgi:asparagine synthase (glutamine-hydrolysing)